MAKLRHIAMQVPDLEKAARFYETSLGLTRVAQTESPIGNAIMLTDGTMNFTLLNFPEGKGGQMHGPDWAGLHHIGFVVDSEDETAQRIKDAGGSYFMRIPAGYPGVDAEAKFKDPFGVSFDVSEHIWTIAPRSSDSGN